MNVGIPKNRIFRAVGNGKLLILSDSSKVTSYEEQANNIDCWYPLDFSKDKGCEVSKSGTTIPTKQTVSL